MAACGSSFTWSRVRQKKLLVSVISEAQTGCQATGQESWDQLCHAKCLAWCKKSGSCTKQNSRFSVYVFLFCFLMSHPRCSVDVFLKGLIVELTLVSRGLSDRSFFFSLSQDLSLLKTSLDTSGWWTFRTEGAQRELCLCPNILHSKWQAATCMRPNESQRRNRLISRSLSCKRPVK